MRFRDLKNIKLKNYQKFTLMVISENPGVPSKTTKIAMLPAISFFLSYSLLVAFLGFLLIGMSPVKDIIFSGSGMNSNDRLMVKELNDRMIFLSGELEKIRAANDILRKSISEPKIEQVKKGGNILAVVRDFFNRYLYSQNDITFINPAVGYISRGFLPENGHMGIDYVLKSGTPVHAAANGFVLFSDYTSGSGYMIIISHPDEYITIYRHCSSLIKKEREKVFQGELIALSGNSGEITTGPHLHFEIWKQGKPINPLTVLNNN